MLLDILRNQQLSMPQMALAVAALLVSIVIAITVHECAHAWSAHTLGDDTAKNAGRLTLNPLVHYDPVGTTLLLVFGFGWAKPVPINPSRMKNPRWDSLQVALWGPASNVIVAFLFAMVVRYGPPFGRIADIFLLTIIELNLFLAFFNLIPLPPLDGSRIIGCILPRDAANAYDRFTRQYGMLILFGVLFFGSYIFGGPISNAVDTTMSAFLGLRR